MITNILSSVFLTHKWVRGRIGKIMTKNIEQLFRKQVINTFSTKRVVSLLYFGSRAFNINICVDSDYDFMLILDKYHYSDILKLRDISQSSAFESLDLNINIMYLRDIEARGKSNFQIRSVQSSLYKYLENAKVLMGKNIFKENPLKLSSKKVRDLMAFKIQEYYGRCDKITLQNRPSAKLYSHLQKYTREILRMVLIQEHIMSIDDIIDTPYTKVFELIILKKYLPQTLKKDLPLLLKDKINEFDIKKINKIRRMAYDRYLKLFAEKRNIKKSVN